MRPVQGPIDPPIDPQAVTGKKYRPAELAPRHVIRGGDPDDILNHIRRLLEHIFMDDRRVIIGGVVFVIRPAAERDARHIDPRSIDHPFIVGDHLGKFAFAVLVATLF